MNSIADDEIAETHQRELRKLADICFAFLNAADGDAFGLSRFGTTRSGGPLDNDGVTPG